MQYFRFAKNGRYRPCAVTRRIELLFYLVTCLFAQWLCRRRQENFAIEFKEPGVTQKSRYRSTLMSAYKYRIISV